MLIPHLHFCGNCKEAISMYEKAFNTKTEALITGREYGSTEPNADDCIAHAVMCIHGQKIFLNDRFGKSNDTTDVAIHLIVMFENKESFLSCYDKMK